MAAPPFRWLVVTDASVAGEDDTIAVVDRLAAALGGETVAVGLRDHALGARAKLAYGRRVRRATRASGAALVVFDRLDLASLVEADGVHLGERSVSVAEAREIVPSARWVGRSCHDATGLHAAMRDDASYATLSPIFSSPGKGEPIGLARASTAIAACRALPVFALGGVDADSVAAALATGAYGVAMIRGALAEGEIDRLLTAARALREPSRDR